MRNFPLRKTSSNRGSNPGQGLQEIFTLLQEGSYEQVERRFRQLEERINFSGQGTLKAVLAAAIQICLVCAQVRSEAEQYRQGYQAALQREQRLQAELGEIVRQVLAGEEGSNEQPGSDLASQPPSQRSLRSLNMRQRLIDLFKTSFQRHALSMPVSETLPRLSASASEKMTLTESSLDAAQPALPFSGISGEAQKLKKPNLVVYLLGSFQVFQGDASITEWESLKAKQIFKYLLVHRGVPVMKDVLMDCFWPDASPEAAPRNLHQAIYSLRQTLRGKQPEFQHVRFVDDHYFFNPDLEIWSDFEEFERHVQEGQKNFALGHSAEAFQQFEIAENLYLGELLEEDLYDEWVKPKRLHLQSLYFEIATLLINNHLQALNNTSAIALCRKVLGFDRCNEEVNQQLIRCYLGQGQRQLALKQCLLCFSALKEELGLPPSDEMLKLYRQITG